VRAGAVWQAWCDQVPNILQEFPQELLQRDSLDRLHLLIEAARIVKTDVETACLPDQVLDRALSDPKWAAQRGRKIRFDRALLPTEITQDGPGLGLALGTTQVSVADRYGRHRPELLTGSRPSGRRPPSPEPPVSSRS
jgi:gamma-glutamyltranspeptidase